MAVIKKKNANGDWDFLQLTGEEVKTLKEDVSSVKSELAQNASKQKEIHLDIVRDFGAVGDANYLNETDKKYYKDSSLTTLATDNTAKIQEALNYPTSSIRTIYIPDGTYMVNAATKLILKSNTKLIFSKNAKFVALASWRDISSILEIVNVENIEIINPVLVGDRDLVSFTTEGAGHGISVRGVKNLTIHGGNLSKCFTDGIYINNVENCLIEYLTSDNNRRQGMSLVSAKNFLCRNSSFKNSNAIAPMMGIDIEPNTANERFENVVFENITTENNASSGIGFNFNRLDNLNTIIDITIRNWTDRGSRVGLSATHNAGSISEASKIEIIDMKSIDARAAGVNIAGYKADGTAKIRLVRPIVLNPNKSLGTNERAENVGISVHTEVSGYTAGTVQGNIDIIEPFISMEDGRSILRGIFIGFGNPYKKILIENPLRINIGDNESLSANGNHNLLSFTNVSQGQIRVFDKYNTLSLSTSTGLIRNYSTSPYTHYISTLSQSGTVTLREWQRWDCIEETTVIHDGLNVTMTLIVELPSTVTFIDETNSVVTGSYSTTTKGAVLKFKKVKEGMFRITKEYGTWTVA